MKKRLDELISFFRPSLFASLLFIIGTSNSELRAADENLKTLGSLVSDVEELNEELARETLNVLLKYQQDIEVTQKEIPRLIKESTSH